MDSDPDLDKDDFIDDLEDKLEDEHPDWDEDTIEEIAEEAYEKELKKRKAQRKKAERTKQKKQSRKTPDGRELTDIPNPENQDNSQGQKNGITSFQTLEEQAVMQYSTEIEDLLQHGRIQEFNERLRIDAWSTISKLLIYLALPGFLLFLLNLIGIVPYIVNWFYIMAAVILLGFIVTGPGKIYNWFFVMAVFLVFVFIPTPSFQLILSAAEQTPPDPNAIGFTDAVGRLADNPLSNVTEYAINFVHVLNWIVFIGMIGVGGSTIGDFLSGDWGKIAQKAAMIALAIGIMTFVYSMMNAILETTTPAVWDTVGGAWNDLLKGIGLAQLDSTGNPTNVLTGRSIGLGLTSWVPILFPFFLVGAAVGMRNIDFKSIMFIRYVQNDESTLKVEESKHMNAPNILLAIFGGVMIMYLFGYVLLNGEGRVVISPIVTLGFYIGTFFVLFLIFLKFLIVNTFHSFGAFLKNLILWTLFGLMILYIWFQVLQPVFYQMNLIDSPNAILVFSQTGSVFENNALEQLFIIATPETMVFQILFVGLGNRIYYYIRKGTLIKRERQDLIARRKELEERKNDIKITQTMSDTNLRRIILHTALKQKIDKIDQKLGTLETQTVPIKYFILPTILFGMLGSFFFSSYHTIRRGINIWYWWRHPFFGMVYWGAGMVLSLVAFFCWPASILVHAFNNIIAILLGG